MTSAVLTADEQEIAGMVRTFFADFTSGTEPETYDVAGFIEPRAALLSGGTLVDFSEWALDGHTKVFGDVAQHWGGYAKAGVQDGTPFTGCGMKSVPLVRTSAGWRISAVAWDDERE